jgi:hypothetical protein
MNVRAGTNECRDERVRPFPGRSQLRDEKGRDEKRMIRQLDDAHFSFDIRTR